MYGLSSVNLAPGDKDVVAAVVPKYPATYSPQALFAVCRDALEPNAVPALIQVLAHIPKTASEKPLDRVLVEAISCMPHQVHRFEKPMCLTHKEPPCHVN